MKNELMGDVGDIQAHCGRIRIDEAEIIVMTELDEYLCMPGLISGARKQVFFKHCIWVNVVEQTVGVGEETGCILE